MTNEKLYQSLIEIGLKDYLKQRGNGNIYQEAHMLKIDSFVKNLSDNQKKILKDKISKKKNETHAQHNNMLHEVSIACAFYDNNVNFLPETSKRMPDFYSGDIDIEVKTINHSEVECERLNALNSGPSCNISHLLNQEEEGKMKKEFINGLVKKFIEKIENAKIQLNKKGGHLWVIYTVDSPPKFHKDISSEVKKEFKKIIKRLSFELKKSKISVNYIHFETLRKKIAG